jgi:sterol desaturase/sphingolipid hydroxylase (fatty acid hydroxylase superfamily)
MPNCRLNKASIMKKIAIFSDFEFFIKVAISCAILQQLFFIFFAHLKLNFITEVIIYWTIGSLSFYGIGLLIEKFIKTSALKNTHLIRIAKVKAQKFPPFTLKGIIFGEIKSFVSAFIILYCLKEVHRDNNFTMNFGWFFMNIVCADLFFYITHRLLHQKRFIQIHLKHHEFRDSSSFVAGHKSLIEYCITTMTELVPVLLFGYDLSQLCAWTVIGNAYNLEGHSSLSLFYIGSDFHDRHHTHFKNNYGIQGFWDRIFNTLEISSKRNTLLFPSNYLSNKFYD